MDPAPNRGGLSPAALARVFHTPSLLYFLAVSEELSIRAAARRLHVASSAVARQVMQLEAALGMPLFERQARRLSLTAAGEILLRHARQLAAPLDAAVSELDLLAGLRSGTIRIATVESVGLTLLPRIVASFAGRYPRLHVDIRMAPAAEVIDLVADHEVDMGFTFIARPPRGLDVAIRRDLPIGAVMRPDHPLAANPSPTFAECAAHLVAVPRRGLSIRDVLEPFIEQEPRGKSSFVEVNSIRMLVELAASGRYVAFVTALGIDRDVAEGRIVFRPLSDKGLPLNRFGLVLRAAGSLRFAPAAFFDHAKGFFDTIEGLS
ncbi:LysR family transcriptional regulator [Prosthecomicrobium pneumaticum]|uniref:DNA-binding transcriptional LysR family regulator n=1 Tax=Prosthecomicrobium pneumaticum TaxID=81895 RepID=A0A7W9CTS7_9HYPH|nr:LysR substrate-binding domain-containing protein [Prosthecomicrobium pneumaticum]MBB5751277.1 DNA-binding transcriptional LysR family regulator [Prosthecomicrobium pneumaticum]